jgi:uncharacterized protein YhaN
VRLLRLHLQAFGPFTDRVLELGSAGQRLVLVHGPNEAGKSSALRAISDLRFGIPQQSSDNFVHAHPDMRVGGVFIDSRGREHSLVRRKGRGATLLLADAAAAGDGDALAAEAAPPELEALLGCGLTRDEYEQTFAIDHARLRKGGRELLDGKGEIGAALFEASAGVRSIPQILERLEQSARKFFMPGARGKNARINEALRDYNAHHAAFRQSLVRPALWAELSRKHQAAAEELAALEARRRELSGQLLQIGELRAVAPLLATLDHASRTLQQMQAVPLLSETAAAERAAAESGLAAARHDAQATSAEIDRQQQRLTGLALDTAMLQVAAPARRLVASAETIDSHRADLAAATAEREIETQRVAALAARIDARASTEKVVAHAPAPAVRAGIEERLLAAERADQALAQHLESAARHAAESEATATVQLPSPESRTALRVARLEIERNDALLRRLANLPAQIKAARRALASALDGAGLADEAEFRRARPLLDAEIDEQISEQRRDATRREELEKRLAQIVAALEGETERRDRLLEQGAVPTRDEVLAARSRRETGWALVRGTYIDATMPRLEEFSGDRPLPLAYEQAVADADRLADALAADHERAAQLQSRNREIAKLEHDEQLLSQQLAEIARDEGERQSRWRRMLSAAHLPELSPTALRDWQARLALVRAASEALQSCLDELDEAQAAERRLAANLRAAIVATGLASPASDALLDTLSATASEVEEVIRQRERLVDTAAGRRSQRERQQQQMAAREAELAGQLRDARSALAPMQASLQLAENASVAVTRARLAEFDELLTAHDRMVAAESKELRARQALSVLENRTLSIAADLGDPEPADIRLYIERISDRLDAAEATEKELALARQALEAALDSQRRHEETAARHESTLAKLCLAAGADSVAMLPEAEEQSRRKREAQLEFDRASGQLAQASRRPAAELRALLENQDAARMDADEAACRQAQVQLDDELGAARQREEAARHALQAIDDADTAAAEREAMERAAARVRADMLPWIRSRIARALLAEAMKQFRDRAQGPMLQSASAYFERMTGGEFVRLVTDDADDDRPVLVAERRNGARLGVEGMSEGTLDQLYLALRLAALELRRDAGVDLPVILDDVLMTSDDDRAVLMLRALADFSRGGQVIVFTHHRHLADLAIASLPKEVLAVARL